MKRRQHTYWGFPADSGHIRVVIMVAASLLTTLLLALVVAARPTARSLARTPLKKNVQTGNPVRYDQRRIEHLKAKGGDLNARQAINSPADNRAVVYTASIGVGSPATQCK